jgi:PPK2 family polyphosphate:nucleotide phosphotransferase
MDLEHRFRVRPQHFTLADHDPGDTAGLDKDASEELRAKDLERLDALQERLYAEGRRSLLVVFQAMDAAGKDGTIEHVMSGLNPQGVRVTSFKQPTRTELAHDWLWRCQLALPARGEIGIFNRSHYEEVIAVRVHPEWLAAQAVEPTRALWEQRYAAITSWERHLHASGTRVVKFFLHVSKAEQRERFLARADETDKTWKFSAGDVAERERWDDYQRAFEQALKATSAEHARGT